MSQTSQFSLANRKQLADVLKDDYNSLRSKVKRQLREKRSRLRETLIKKYAEEKGASAVVKQVQATEKRYEELTSELKQLGFELSGGSLSLYDHTRNPLDDIIDQRIDKEIGSENDIDARFDSAQIAMMTVASLQDAEKLLKSVSEI